MRDDKRITVEITENARALAKSHAALSKKPIAKALDELVSAGYEKLQQQDKKNE